MCKINPWFNPCVNINKAIKSRNEPSIKWYFFVRTKHSNAKLSPLELICQLSKEDAFTALIEKLVLHVKERQGFLFSSWQKNIVFSKTPVMIAARYGAVNNLVKLIELGFNIEARDCWGWRAISFAVEHALSKKKEVEKLKDQAVRSFYSLSCCAKVITDNLLKKYLFSFLFCPSQIVETLTGGARILLSCGARTDFHDRLGNRGLKMIVATWITSSAPNPHHSAVKASLLELLGNKRDTGCNIVSADDQI